MWENQKERKKATWWKKQKQDEKDGMGQTGWRSDRQDIRMNKEIKEIEWMRKDGRDRERMRHNERDYEELKEKLDGGEDKRMK